MFEAILILVFLYLPGYVLGGSLARKGDGWVEIFLLQVSCGVAVATPVLVGLALVGWFRTPVIVASLLVCAAAAGVVRRYSGAERPACARLSGWDLGVLALMVGSLALYAARPAEYVFKDRDPGVYVVLAAKLARSGWLLTRDPLVGAVSSFHEFEDQVKYPGFYLHGEDLIVPQFFPGPFAWMGLGEMVAGTWGILYVAPIFGALSVGVVCLLGRELFGRWAGLLGAGLLAVSYAQVWWARYPSSEAIAQFFILAGLWTGARFVRGGGKGTGVLAGALLGGAMLVRVDAFLAALVVPALIGYDLLRGRPVVRRWAPVCVPLLLLGGAAAAYTLTIGQRYLGLINDLHVPNLARGLFPYLLLLGVVLAAACALFLARRRWRERLGLLLDLYGRQGALLVALAFVGAALWAYFVLPEPWEGLPSLYEGTASGVDRMSIFGSYDRQVTVRMVWFVTPAVAILGMAGFALAAYRLDAGRALFLGVVLGFTFLYVTLPNVAPDLPWATRRFVPAAFPGLCLLAGYAVIEAGQMLARVRGAPAGVACAAALAVVSLAWSVQVAWPIYGAQELRGAVESFEELKGEIPAAGVVYVEEPGGSYGATLDYLHGRPVLVYEREEFRREIPQLREAGLLEDAVYVTVEERVVPYFPGLRPREVGRGEVSLLRLEQEFKSIPRETYEERQGFRVYALEER